MQWHYQLTKADYLAFNLYIYHRSALARRSRRVQRWLALVFPLMPLATWGTTGTLDLAFLIGFAVLGVLWFLFYPKWFERSVRRRLMRVIDEQFGANVCIDEQLSADEDALVEDSAAGDTLRVRWSTLEKIGETETHVFFFIHAMAAIIVPKRVFTNEAEIARLKQFVPKTTPID
ncbi:MAG: YcxB family protein [Sporolactobacillus sp.]